jgi:hypothetical protein
MYWYQNTSYYLRSKLFDSVLSKLCIYLQTKMRLYLDKIESINLEWREYQTGPNMMVLVSHTYS